MAGLKDTGSPLEIRRSGIQGLGAFAARKIRKGARIIEYVGERITSKEADERYDDEGMGRHHTFLFAIDEDVTIDGAIAGNDSRYINHCCAPNCEAVDEDGRIFIFATKRILEGEELSYDYQYDLDLGPEDAELKERYVCHCGADTCRGTIVKPVKKKKKKAKSKSKKKA